MVCPAHQLLPSASAGMFSCIPAMSRMVEDRLVDCFKSGAGIRWVGGAVDLSGWAGGVSRNVGPDRKGVTLAYQLRRHHPPMLNLTSTGPSLPQLRRD